AQRAQHAARRTYLRAQLTERQLLLQPVFPAEDHRELVVGLLGPGNTAQRMLGVVELAAREPPHTGHPVAFADRARLAAPPHADELAERGPERVELVDRPPPQVFVAADIEPVLLGQPSFELLDAGVGQTMRIRTPEDFGDVGHAPQTNAALWIRPRCRASPRPWRP